MSYTLFYILGQKCHFQGLRTCQGLRITKSARNFYQDSGLWALLEPLLLYCLHCTGSNFIPLFPNHTFSQQGDLPQWRQKRRSEIVRKEFLSCQSFSRREKSLCFCSQLIVQGTCNTRWLSFCGYPSFRSLGLTLQSTCYVPNICHVCQSGLTVFVPHAFWEPGHRLKCINIMQARIFGEPFFTSSSYKVTSK